LESASRQAFEPAVSNLEITPWVAEHPPVLALRTAGTSSSTINLEVGGGLPTTFTGEKVGEQPPNPDIKTSCRKL
jgi:hypothetical protein